MTRDYFNIGDYIDPKFLKEHIDNTMKMGSDCKLEDIANCFYQVLIEVAIAHLEYETLKKKLKRGQWNKLVEKKIKRKISSLTNKRILIDFLLTEEIQIEDIQNLIKKKQSWNKKIKKIKKN